MIDLNKKYRTKDGREVRIYATDGGERGAIHGEIGTIHGAIKKENGWFFAIWPSNGISHFSDYDLVEVKENKTVKVWANIHTNVFVDGFGNKVNEVFVSCYENKDDADEYADHNRKACKLIEIDYEEGEGL
jgi:hypothetical protein